MPLTPPPPGPVRWIVAASTATPPLPERRGHHPRGAGDTDRLETARVAASQASAGQASAPAGPRRRTLLLSATGAATAVALVAGCTDDSTPKTRAVARQRSAQDRSRARAARESRALVAQYDAVLAAHPASGPRLEPLRAEVARHAEAFGGAPVAASATPTQAAAGSTPGPSGAPRASGAPEVPVSETDALGMLARAERALASRRVKELPDVPGELARLLASVAAAGAAHAYLLTEGDR